MRILRLKSLREPPTMYMCFFRLKSLLQTVDLLRNQALRPEALTSAKFSVGMAQKGNLSTDSWVLN